MANDQNQSQRITGDAQLFFPSCSRWFYYVAPKVFAFPFNASEYSAYSPELGKGKGDRGGQRINAGGAGSFQNAGYRRKGCAGGHDVVD